MAFVVRQDGDDLGLEAWAARHAAGPARRRSAQGAGRTGLRFAFYGRTSRADYQDRLSSRGWQREVAEAVIAGHGAIVGEFFDVGCSRRIPWPQRPQASALLVALQAGQRRFDAVVGGEYERAFASGDQFTQLA